MQVKVKLNDKVYDFLKKWGTIVSGALTVISSLALTLDLRGMPKWVPAVFGVLTIVNKFIYTAASKNYYQGDTVADAVNDTSKTISEIKTLFPASPQGNTAPTEDELNAMTIAGKEADNG